MILKCKMCGGDLDVHPGRLVAECLFCGSLQTVPNISDEKKATLYDRAGYYRRNNEYDKALGLYEQLISEDNTDAEAHWNAVLCRYGIEYVEDARSHRRIPTVNRTHFKSIFEDIDYTSALKFADEEQTEIYKKEADIIDSIQKEILEFSYIEEPFDVFICYKESDNQGRRTSDSVIAYEIYKELKKEGYRVFFARVTLEDKLGTAYEPYIFAALNSAKIMLVVGTSADNLNSVWVKNEWSRYLAFMQEDDSKSLIPVYKDMSPYDMPEEFAFLQAQDFGKIGALQDIVRGVQKLLTNNQNISNGANTDDVGSISLLKRAYMYLEDQEWSAADKYFERALDADPECGDAYLGKILFQNRCKNISELSGLRHIEYDDKDFSKFLKYGKEQDISFVKEVISKAERENLKEKNRRKRKAKKAIKIISVATLLFSSIALIIHIVLKRKRTRETYEEAISKLDDNSLEAYELAESIKGYDGVVDVVNESAYSNALKSMETGNLGDAELYLSYVEDGYQDKDELLKLCDQYAPDVGVWVCEDEQIITRVKIDTKSKAFTYTLEDSSWTGVKPEVNYEAGTFAWEMDEEIPVGFLNPEMEVALVEYSFDMNTRTMNEIRHTSNGLVPIQKEFSKSSLLIENFQSEMEN